MRQMKADGVERAIAFVTSAYSSYSACRQYLDDIDRAVAAAGPGAPRIDKIRPYFNHPGFIEPFAAGVEDGPGRAARRGQAGARLVFTAHSVPRRHGRRERQPVGGHRGPRCAGGRYAAELRRGLPAYRRTGAWRLPASPSTSSSRAAAARRACPGWNRT